MAEYLLQVHNEDENCIFPPKVEDWPIGEISRWVCPDVDLLRETEEWDPAEGEHPTVAFLNKRNLYPSQSNKQLLNYFRDFNDRNVWVILPRLLPLWMTCQWVSGDPQIIPFQPYPQLRTAALQPLHINRKLHMNRKQILQSCLMGYQNQCWPEVLFNGFIKLQFLLQPLPKPRSKRKTGLRW